MDIVHRFHTAFQVHSALADGQHHFIQLLDLGLQLHGDETECAAAAHQHGGSQRQHDLGLVGGLLRAIDQFFGGLVELATRRGDV